MLKRSEKQKRTQRHRTRKYTLKKFGMTFADEAALLSFQNNVCAICKTKRPSTHNKRYWSVDHDHVTGKVRGLLCHDCNCGLGYMRDDTGFLANAILYLQNPPANAVLH